MHKSELLKELSEMWSITEKHAKLCVDVVFDTLTETLTEGGRIEIRGFGSLKVNEYQSYKGRNPKTGELVQVPEKRLPVFKMSSILRKRINKNP